MTAFHSIGLEPYVPSEEAPWNLARVHHLHWRAGCGATMGELEEGLASGPGPALERMLAGTREAGVPEGAALLSKRLRQSAFSTGGIVRMQAWWFWRMLYANDPLGERLTLLWHDHFATSAEKVDSVRLMGTQNLLFREHARGRFGDLLAACVKHPAVLLWLDAPSNYRAHPNENLARELMELFTLGEGHYDETDVREVARALTGWRVDHKDEFTVRSEHHDPGEKSILGQRGHFDGDALLGILLEHPATARRVAWRLCRMFFGDDLVSPALLDALAEELRATDLDLGRCVARILRSRLFFSEANMRVLASPPAVHAVALARALECFAPVARSRDLSLWSARMGQRLFYPPNVFGWPHGTEWITTGTLVARSRYARALVAGELSLDDDEGPVARLVERHAVPEDPEARVDFFGRLLLGQDPRGTLRTTLIATASSKRQRACETMVAQLCTAPACQLS